MMERQSETGGFLPEKDVAPIVNQVDVEDVLRREEGKEDEEERRDKLPAHLKHQSIAIRPLSLGNWMFDVVADLTSSKPAFVPPPLPPPYSPPTTKKERRETIQIPSPTVHFNLPAPLSIDTSPSRRHMSLQFTPTSPVFHFDRRSSMVDPDQEEDDDGWQEKEVVQRSGATARTGRENKNGVRSRGQGIALATIKTPSAPAETSETQPSSDNPNPPQFWSLMRAIYPTIPNKPVLFLGLFIAACSGSVTPVFSFLLSRLLFEVSIGAQDVSTINKFGGIVLGFAALDGIFLGLKYYIMEYCGMSWTTYLRSTATQKILKQDKKWFDIPRHSAADMVQVVVKDGDDARNLISVVWSQFLVVTAMLGVGLIWALVRGWQLTLAGFAIAPVFAGVVALQSRLVGKCEARNKKAREDIARGYYDVRSSFLFFSLFFVY